MQLAGFQDISQILNSGIYALVSRGEVVYVGQSRGMLVRLYQHRNNARRHFRREPGWSKVKGIAFDAVWVMPVPIGRLDEVEREMIARFRPRHNDRLVPKQGLPPEVMAKLGLGQSARDELEGFVRRV